jgi:flagellar biosynthesis/type III secretory pathway chaperone
MAAMRQRLRTRGREVAKNVALFRSMTGAEDLRHRISVLEDEVQECRQLNLRLAELTDVVQEMLLPVAERDEARIAEVMDKYARGL